MFLALKEMARAKVRFALLIAAIALLVFLILFQQSLQNGLITGFIGAIRNQSAPVLVYSVDGQRTVQGSIITPELDALVRAAPGVGEVGQIGQGTFTGQPVSGDGDTYDTSLFGYELGPDGRVWAIRRRSSRAGFPTADFEGVASDADVDLGYGVGDVVDVAAGRPRDHDRRAWPRTSNSTCHRRSSRRTTPTSRPCRAATPTPGRRCPNVLAVSPAEGTTPDELVASINDQSLELDALTREDAAADTPGVAQVQQSFNIIFLLYGLVVPCVTGLFFLIITFQKANSLTLLRAIGAPARRLVAVAAHPGRHHRRPRPDRRDAALRCRSPAATSAGCSCASRPVRSIFWSVLLMTLGILSSLIAARRVLRIEPDRGHHRCRSERRTMKLALKELRRRPSRFATATVILTLDRHPADVPRRPARRADQLIGRRHPGAAGRCHRVRLDGAGIVRAEPHRPASCAPRSKRSPGSPRSAASGSCSSAPACRATGRANLAGVALFGYETRARRCPRPAARRPGVRRRRAEGRRRRGRHDDRTRPGTHAGRDHRFRVGHQLQRAGRAVGIAGHLARHPGRQPARRAGRRRCVPGARRAQRRRRTTCRRRSTPPPTAGPSRSPSRERST